MVGEKNAADTPRIYTQEMREPRPAWDTWCKARKNLMNRYLTSKKLSRTLRPRTQRKQTAKKKWFASSTVFWIRRTFSLIPREPPTTNIKRRNKTKKIQNKIQERRTFIQTESKVSSAESRTLGQREGPRGHKRAVPWCPFFPTTKVWTKWSSHSSQRPKISAYVRSLPFHKTDSRMKNQISGRIWNVKLWIYRGDNDRN